MKTTTNEKPILFSGEMVRAILAERKTQTRRIIKGMNNNGFMNLEPDMAKCPFEVGMRLWVRETFIAGWELGKNQLPQQFDEDGNELPKKVWHRADRDTDELVWLKECGEEFHENVPWKPSIHMPRWASRITLEIVSVRVERVQEISDAAAKAEGVEITDETTGCSDDFMGNDFRLHHSIAFKFLWNSVHGPDAWDLNPWVWVIEFKKV